MWQFRFRLGIHSWKCYYDPDHNPTEENGYVRRDYEYMRLGTLSLLAGIDLLTGEAIPLVSQTHKSSDFIGFLKILAVKYPEGDTIRLILDNHSAHTSKETRQFLATFTINIMINNTTLQVF